MYKTVLYIIIRTVQKYFNSVPIWLLWSHTHPSNLRLTLKLFEKQLGVLVSWTTDWLMIVHQAILVNVNSIFLLCSAGTNIKEIINILSTRSNSQRLKIALEYKSQFGRVHNFLLSKLWGSCHYMLLYWGSCHYIWSSKENLQSW